MSHCFEPREIGAVVALPEGDPGRRHLDTCPRCRGLALAYAEFMTPSDAGSLDIRAADAELQRRLAIAQATEARRGRWLGLLRPPRPAWGALAAVLALVAFGLMAGDLNRLLDGRLPDGTGVVRGDVAEPGLQVMKVDEGLLATWPPPPPRSTGCWWASTRTCTRSASAPPTPTACCCCPTIPWRRRLSSSWCTWPALIPLARSAIVAPDSAVE